MTSRQNSIELDGTTIPITIGNYTNRSSQVSLYRSSCLSRVKFISLIVSFSLSVATLAIASNIYKTETMRNTTTDAIRLITVPRFNSTLCDYFKHFFQSGDYFATGCSYLRECLPIDGIPVNGGPLQVGYDATNGNTTTTVLTNLLETSRKWMNNEGIDISRDDIAGDSPFTHLIPYQTSTITTISILRSRETSG
ncbi:unnamed protein product [Mytilus edulis]|uniref:Uncharacterized protein n=1 Tax=Mytilus edulis TaxID=6550 RepID=A0A8S3UBL8_MYTED|nr:unnamed protein product [Mytilus edulis]